ncbi:hypothetical protein SDC9_147002 [bioreactor metagenome]|uniref:Uncharacterized protein n=1 Tax=bioreactor metagenome TaxID=1076179 RepID=A0A645EFC0_9ZZZZ
MILLHHSEPSMDCCLFSETCFDARSVLQESAAALSALSSVPEQCDRHTGRTFQYPYRSHLFSHRVREMLQSHHFRRSARGLKIPQGVLLQALLPYFLEYHHPFPVLLFHNGFLHKGKNTCCLIPADDRDAPTENSESTVSRENSRRQPQCFRPGY